jgi:MFS-type transporter involved in bile tolerance (Atg22 family)
MTLLRDIAGELYSMFMADVALSGAILALVAVIGTVDGLGLDHRLGGAALIAGCLAIIVVVTSREARRRRS